MLTDTGLSLADFVLTVFAAVFVIVAVCLVSLSEKCLLNMIVIIHLECSSVCIHKCFNIYIQHRSNQCVCESMILIGHRVFAVAACGVHNRKIRNQANVRRKKNNDLLVIVKSCTK